MQGSYNGRPLFIVGESDFMYVVECRECGKRLLSKNIVNESLKEYYTNARKPEFAVSYDDVIVYYGGNEV